MWKNMGTNLGWNVGIDDTMVIDSNVMTTCISPFSKPLLDFHSMPKSSTFTNMLSCKFVVKISLSNKSQCKYA
jgi:hypothetical protein